jgi:hypothetical protein
VLAAGLVVATAVATGTVEATVAAGAAVPAASVAVVSVDDGAEAPDLLLSLPQAVDAMSSTATTAYEDRIRLDGRTRGRVSITSPLVVM